MSRAAPLLLTAFAAGTLLYLHSKGAPPKDVAPGTTPSAAGGGAIQPDQILTLEVITNNAPVYAAPYPDLKTPFGTGPFLGALPAGTAVSLIAVDGEWVRILKRARVIAGTVVDPPLEGWVGMGALKLLPTARRTT